MERRGVESVWKEMNVGDDGNVEEGKRGRAKENEWRHTFAFAKFPMPR
jgi:hypothetical protein